MKVQSDIQSSKKENLIPTFAKVNLSIKNSNRKIKLCITRIVMECEMENKQQEKKEVKERYSFN